jgi:hypothetical protein
VIVRVWKVMRRHLVIVSKNGSECTKLSVSADVN